MLRGLPIPTVRNCPAARHSTRSVVRGRYQVHTSARSVVSQDMAACIERTQDEQSQPEQQQASVLHLLADAHCHPQLDPANMHEVRSLQSCRLAAMSVAHDVDWDIMMELHKLAGHKVIPGFGIHPWWSHLHASSQGTSWHQLLEAPSAEQQQAAIDILAQHDPVTNSGAYATNRPAKPDQSNWSKRQASNHKPLDSKCHHHHDQQQQQQQQPINGSGSDNPEQGDKEGFQGIHSNGDAPQQQQQQQQCLGNGLRVVPCDEWEGRLRELLQQVPTAIVGEIGIDRSAMIPGSKAKTKLQHQMELLQRQVAIAAEYQRPVSIHCVRGYGHLYEFFQQRAKVPESCPTKIMLHSYGGSVEEIPRFYKLPGIGDRVYYSFSHAINHRTPDKLRARIAAVPDDKLLIESDQVTPLVIDDGLLQICQTVAEVKGWSLQKTAQRMLRNFEAFYAEQIPNA